MALHTSNPLTKSQMNLAPFSNWTSGFPYNTGDFVLHSTAIWKATRNNIADTPTSTSTSWTLQLGGGGGGGTPGGASPEYQYNSSGAFAGSPEFSYGIALTGGYNLPVFPTGAVADDMADFIANGAGGDVGIGNLNGGLTLTGIGGSTPVINFYQAGGTYTGPLVTSSGQSVGELAFYGQSSTGLGGNTGSLYSLSAVATNDAAPAVRVQNRFLSGGSFAIQGDGQTPTHTADTINLGIATTPELRIGSSTVTTRAPSVFMLNLPTTAPAGSKQLWVSSGVIAITA